MNRKFLAALVAGAVGLFAAPAAQAASATHHFYAEPGSYLTIVDDEWGDDVVEKFELSNLYLGNFSGVTNSTTLTFSRCAGGEVKVVVHLLMSNWNTTYTTVRYWLDLYEGITCATNDWDGWYQSGLRQVGMPFENFSVKNIEEGGDSAVLHIKLREKVTI